MDPKEFKEKMKGLVPVREAAPILGYSWKTLYNWHHKKENLFIFVKINGKLRVDLSKCDQLIKYNKD